MLARIITSYIEKNTNSKIGVLGAMLIGTNETKIVQVEHDSNKMSKKCKDERGRMPLPIRTLKGLKREKFLLLRLGAYL
jgi:hypothetical protein